MIRLLVSVLALLALPLAAKAADPMPEPADGEVIAFDVFRDGDTRFGTHEVRFEREGEDLMATVTIRLRAGLGPITVFRYDHDSQELWRAGELIGLDGRTRKDGNIYTVRARSEDGMLAVDGIAPDETAFELVAPATITSSSHWHGYPVGMESMLNTEHGTLMETDVIYLGETEIEGDGGQIAVSHYRLSSSLVVDLYYDANGRWAGCTFDARGQQVRYVRRFNPAQG